MIAQGCMGCIVHFIRNVMDFSSMLQQSDFITEYAVLLLPEAQYLFSSLCEGLSAVPRPVCSFHLLSNS